MKICAIICEFNPFHNGHKYLLESVRAKGGYDAVLCIMSGPFTQRGDMAVLDKFTRARHAVLGGADCVIELPQPFAVAPAPVFARGAIKILSSVPEVSALAFGCEEMLDFRQIAASLTDENQTFKELLSEGLGRGESYIKSYGDAAEKMFGQSLNSPNNILATEYAKAVLSLRPDIQLVPIKRQGSGYNDRQLGGTYASASAIREHIDDKGVKDYIPPFVAADLHADERAKERWEAIVKYALTAADSDKLSKVYGGGEGLANRLKSLQNMGLEEIISNATTRRYPSSRIRRALTANALGLTAEESNSMLSSGGYIKPLAVKADRADNILAALARSDLPVIITGSDVGNLDENSALMYKRNRFADKVWSIAANKDVYDCTLLKI